MKKKLQRWTGILLSLCLISVCLAFPALAKERKKIDRIALSFSSSIAAGTADGEVYAAIDDPYYASRYRIVNTQILNKPEGVWAGGVSPNVMISLRSVGEYYFSSAKEDAFTLTGAGAGFVSSETLDSGSVLHVTVNLAPLSAPDAAITISGLNWDQKTALATWNHDSNARYYQIQLYKDGIPIGSVITTYSNYYRFAEKLSGEGSYRFLVRSVDNALNRSEWTSSGDWNVSSAEASGFSNGTKNTYGPGTAGTLTQIRGEWKSDDTGWWYEKEDGAYPADRWEYIDGEWYYFDHDGYRKSGWIAWQGTWYYCCEDGSLLTDSTTPDGYKVGSNGAIKE